MGRLSPKGELEAALGRRFKAMRKQRKLRIRAFAKQIGRSVYALQRHESGAMPLRADDIVRAARVMQVEPAELLETGEG